MPKLSEIATAIGAVHDGADLVVTGAAEPAMAGASDLALAMRPEYADGLAAGAARAAILWPGADWRALGLEAGLTVARPKTAMAPLTAMLDPGPDLPDGVHPSAIVHAEAEIGRGARIGPFTVIGRGARIGPGASIGSHVVIREGACIGADALIHDGAHIGARTVAGDRLICQPGCVIGADGFSFATAEENRVEAIKGTGGTGTGGTGQHWGRVHSLGSVELGDDVEVGANSTIDKGTIRATRIGRGTKLDNLVHVGHNVVVGEDCLLCGCVGIAGSAVIGDRCVLGGMTGVIDNVTVGSDVLTGAGTLIMNRVPSGRVMLGYPAIPMKEQISAAKNVRRLPRLMAQVAALTSRLSKGDATD